jgi:hypothetical protein
MSVVTAGILLIGLGFWAFAKRKTFTGPVVNLQEVDEINAGAIAMKKDHVETGQGHVQEVESEKLK